MPRSVWPSLALARRFVPLLLVAAPPALAVTPAHGAEPLSLAWTAPAGCPSRDDVLAETRRLLGGKIDSDAPLAARAEVALAAPSDYRLRITLDRTPGERPREVHAPTCAELGDAAALILALSLDPASVADAPPGTALHADPAAPPPPPAPAPLFFFPPLGAPTFPGGGAPVFPGGAAVPGGLAGTGPSGLAGAGFGGLPGGGALVPSSDLAPVIPVPRFEQPVFFMPAVAVPVPPAVRPPALRVHASIAAEAGALRDVAPMVRAGVALVPGPLRVEATGLLAWGGHLAAPSAPGKGAELWLAGGALEACYEAHVGPRSIAVAACGGVEVGAMLGTSYGVTFPRTGASPWVAPLVGGLFRWPFTRAVALRLDLQLAIPLVHPEFRVEGLGVVHAPEPVGARAGAGIEIDLFSRGASFFETERAGSVH